MKTIIGSTALKKYFPKYRSPKDLDILSSDHSEFKSEKIDGKIVEIIPAPNWWEHKEYATPDDILNLKASHIYLDTSI